MARAGKHESRLDSDTFCWSEDEYTLRELIERFGHQLPFLVIATAGYLGLDDWLGGVATQEIQWLYGFAKQSRLVLMDEAGVYYSVPRCYQGYVIPTRPDGLVHRKMTVADVMDHGKYLYLEFCDKRMSLKVKGRLKIIESYEERYLVGHVLCEGVPATEFTLTPCSVPLKLSVALTVRGAGQKSFFSLMMQFKDYIDQCPHDYTEALNQFSEVTVYKGTPHTGEYEYITSVPLLLANQLPDDQVESAVGVSHSHDLAIPTAYGIYPEHRLGQLKHVFQTREIPEDDGVEVPDPEPKRERKSDKTKKPAAKLKNLFKSKPKKPAENPEINAKRMDAPKEPKPKPKPKPAKDRRGKQRPEESSASKHGFSTLSDVPSDLSSLTVDDVTRCLALLNLSRHQETFKNRLIDGEMLACLTGTMLSSEFGFTEFEATQLSRFARGYRPKMA